MFHHHLFICLAVNNNKNKSSLCTAVTISSNTTVHTTCVSCIYHVDISFLKTHHVNFSVQANYEQVRLC